MQYHGNKTLYQRVFKGIECNTMETKLYIKEFLKVLNAIWKQDMEIEDFKSKSF